LRSIKNQKQTIDKSKEIIKKIGKLKVEKVKKRGKKNFKNFKANSES